MPEKVKITCKQIILIIMISRGILPITYFPGFVDPPGNQDVWIATLLGYPVMLFFSIPLYLLWKRFPNETIFQYSRTIFGKAGKLIGILYILFLIHFTAINLSQLSMFLTTATMPETPLLFFLISMLLASAYVVRNGLEVLARLSELIGPILLIAVTMIVVLVAKEMDFKALLPMLEKGFTPLLFEGFVITQRTVEILGLAILLPFLNESNPKNAKKVFELSLILCSYFMLLTSIAIVTTFGVGVGKTLTFPFYNVVRIIAVADFIERIDAIHIALWVLGGIIKVAFYYYLVVLGISQLLNLQAYKPIVLPVGTIIVPLSVIVGENIVELQNFTSYKVFTWYSSIFIFLIPCSLLITSFIKKTSKF
ncbi:MAG: endospore germination permease [Desulfitobacterium hafniense]|nr:endospore germination permease [Desulfitobacterium hafniense]